MAVLKDRVPGKPGRFLVTPEDCSAPFYAQLELADEPVEPGNKVNAQNVTDTVYPLSDNMAAGVVVQTAQPSPDDRWLLCDGAEVLRADHPELYDQLTPLPLQAQSVRTYTVNSGMTVCNVKYCNGYYIACGTNAGNYKGMIAYATQLAGPWTAVTLPTNGWKSYQTRVYDVAYGDGYYALAVEEYSDNSNNRNSIRIYYTTDLQGSWSCSSGNLGFTSNQYVQIFFTNSQFILVVSSDLTRIYTAKAPTSWTKSKQLDYQLTGITYNNTRRRWECCALYFNYSNSIYNTSIQFCHSNDLENWEFVGNQHLLYSGTAYASLDSMYLGIGDTYLNILSKGKTSSSNSEELVIRCSFDGTGTFNSYEDIYAVPNSSQSYVLLGMCNGTSEMIITHKSEYFRQTANGSFTRRIDNKTIDCCSNDRIKMVKVIVQQNGSFILPSTTPGDIVVFTDIYHRYLPNVAPPDSNGLIKAYIKAK